MPLVFYIRHSLRFLHYIMPALVPIAKILKKIGVTGKIFGESGGQTFKDLTEKSVNFSTLTTSDIGFLLFFGEEDQ